jgi:hypothetical protein
MAQTSIKMRREWLYKFSVLRISFTYLARRVGLVYLRNNEQTAT